jgi:hypothetical protein
MMKDLHRKSDVDRPMGNAELRLTLQAIESELASNTTISLETHAQAKKTNGRVNWMEKTIWLSMGAIPLLTIWAGWLTLEILDGRDVRSNEIQSAVIQALDNYETKSIDNGTPTH